MDTNQTVEFTKLVTEFVLYSVAAIIGLFFTFRRTKRPKCQPGIQAGTAVDNVSLTIPDQCDFDAVADEIRGVLKLAQDEAKAQGQEAYLQYDFLAALVPFLETPSRSTAIPLLKVAPHFRRYFEVYGPDGEFTAYKKILGIR